MSQTYECRPAGYSPDAAVEVKANSPREAAETFQAASDRRTLEYEPESEVIVTLENGVEVPFIVTLESVPSYSAKVKRANPEAR